MDTAPPCPQEFVDFAGALADAAGPVICRYFRTPIPVDSKQDETPVTAADREAEQAMRGLIAERYPDHGIVGEEYGNDRARAEFVWVLDPIDGTKAFITGKPLFGTLIALVRNGVPILGVIDQPVLGERWTGAAGRPTVFNGNPVATRDCGKLAEAVLSTTSPDLFDTSDGAAFRRLAARTRLTQYGGDCYAYALVASGFIDIVVESGLKPYDFCALAPVITGAGGVFSDWTGRPVTMASDGRVIAAGDAALLPESLTILSTSRD